MKRSFHRLCKAGVQWLTILALVTVCQSGIAADTNKPAVVVATEPVNAGSVKTNPPAVAVPAPPAPQAPTAATLTPVITTPGTPSLTKADLDGVAAEIKAAKVELEKANATIKEVGGKGLLYALVVLLVLCTSGVVVYMHLMLVNKNPFNVALKTLLDEFKKQLNPIAASVAEMKGQIEQTGQLLQQQQLVAEEIKGQQVKLKEAAEAFAGKAEKLEKQYRETLESETRKFIEKTDQTAAHLQQGIAKVQTEVDNARDLLVQMATENAEKIRVQSETAVQSMQDEAERSMGGVNEKVGQAMAGAHEAIQTSLNAICDSVNHTVSGIQDAVGTSVGSIRDSVEQSAHSIRTAAEESIQRQDVEVQRFLEQQGALIEQKLDKAHLDALGQSVSTLTSDLSNLQSRLDGVLTQFQEIEARIGQFSEKIARQDAALHGQVWPIPFQENQPLFLVRQGIEQKMKEEDPTAADLFGALFNLSAALRNDNPNPVKIGELLHNASIAAYAFWRAQGVDTFDVTREWSEAFQKMLNDLAMPLEIEPVYDNSPFDMSKMRCADGSSANRIKVRETTSWAIWSKNGDDRKILKHALVLTV
ncbi:MAG: hypothetical protein WCO56_14990 [Verrucomicrobiota bacterium]